MLDPNDILKDFNLTIEEERLIYFKSLPFTPLLYFNDGLYDTKGKKFNQRGIYHGSYQDFTSFNSSNIFMTDNSVVAYSFTDMPGAGNSKIRNKLPAVGFIYSLKLKYNNAFIVDSLDKTKDFSITINNKTYPIYNKNSGPSDIFLNKLLNDTTYDIVIFKKVYDPSPSKIWYTNNKNIVKIDNKYGVFDVEEYTSNTVVFPIERITDKFYGERYTRYSLIQSKRYMLKHVPDDMKWIYE